MTGNNFGVFLIVDCEVVGRLVLEVENVEFFWVGCLLTCGF